MKYIIKSTHRKEGLNYFCAIHGYSPFFNTKENAKRFDSRQAATDYARNELFTDDSAFEIVAE